MTLKIYLLGQFKLQNNDQSFDLPSRPAQSLLAYLALNAGITHRREKLSSLLWPESTETNARGYLRQALWRVRKSMQEGSLDWEKYLQTNDIDIIFNDQSDFWLDANLLLESSDEKSTEKLIETVRLYRGELLPGFYDEWIVIERDRLQAAYHQNMNLLLDCLIRFGKWEDALKWGEEWIRLGFSPEPAFRALMHAHAGLGDQGMVNATYQRCLEALDRELGTEPSPETKNLYESIINREKKISNLPELILPEATVATPDFLDDTKPIQIDEAIFVARESELSQLEDYLSLALAGKGRVVFITGEAGSGKTSLIHEFTKRAQDAKPDLIVASGNCNAHTGIGDPYLPFCEILGLLSGDVEARLAAGAITREHARRLWDFLPDTADALVQFGPNLIGTFLPGAALVKRSTARMGDRGNLFKRLKDVVERKSSSLMIPGLQQSDYFEQYARVLRELARKVPLVLVLDDLQWADSGSVGLLFHLGRQLAGSPIMIIGAYRREEVALRREGTRHPLETVVNEFQREFGPIVVNLEEVDQRKFVDALLDSEPNRLGESFREMLHRQTQGHPLFTIELLRGMQERGDLIQDQQGQWFEGSVLDWNTMPARVEAVISERINRLPQSLQSALQIASVEGEVFTAEVVAQVMETDERKLLTSMSRELDKRHHLISAERIQRSGDQFLSSYRFRHILFQKYLYNSLDEVERLHLHERVGTSLEVFYTAQEEMPVVALQLARHFEEAGIPEKSIYYLHQAGERAVRLSAYNEGIAHLKRGLELLYDLPESTKRDQQELTLQLNIGMAWRHLGPYPQGINAINRARDLCQQLGQTAQMSSVLTELAIYHYVRAEYQPALEFANEALDFARQAQDERFIAECHWCLGFIKFCLGDYTSARSNLRQVISYYNPKEHHHLMVSLRGVDAGLSAQAYDACCLWCLGYPEKALKRSQEVIDLARSFGHAFTLIDVLCYAGCIFNLMRKDHMALREDAQELIQIINKMDLRGWLEIAYCCHGEALVSLGQIQVGTDQINKSININRDSYVNLYRSATLRSLARALAEAGDIQTGLDTLAEALTFVEQTGERQWEAEIYRSQAELLLKLGDKAGAESSYEKAIEVARGQRAKSWELRASTGLARLWKQQGRLEDARSMLSKIYNWFTEGFDTHDLKEAKTLLEELSLDF